MHEEVARVLAGWWRRETRSLLGSAVIAASLQSGLVVLVAAMGSGAFAGLAFFLMILLAGVGVLGLFMKFGYLAFAVVTCAAYPFFRPPRRDFLIAAPGLADGVRVPGTLVGERGDAFEAGVHGARGKLIAQIAFSLPIAIERAFTAWREAMALLSPRANECAAVLAELFLQGRPVPFETLAQRVNCDWQKTLPRLAHVPGLLFSPGRKDAFSLSEDLRLRMADALEADGVVFEVAE